MKGRLVLGNYSVYLLSTNSIALKSTYLPSIISPVYRSHEKLP